MLGKSHLLCNDLCVGADFFGVSTGPPIVAIQRLDERKHLHGSFLGCAGNTRLLKLPDDISCFRVPDPKRQLHPVRSLFRKREVDQAQRGQREVPLGYFGDHGRYDGRKGKHLRVPCISHDSRAERWVHKLAGSNGRYESHNDRNRPQGESDRERKDGAATPRLRGLAAFRRPFRIHQEYIDKARLFLDCRRRYWPTMDRKPHRFRGEDMFIYERLSMRRFLNFDLM